MLARLWHGRTRAADAEAYAAYVTRTGIRALNATPGNRGAMILQRSDGAWTDILVLSLWTSMEAVGRFAGPRPEVPVYYPEDHRYLVELEPRVEHFDVPAFEGGERHHRYHDGRVQSLPFETASGSATVGVITPGRFTRTADGAEHVRVLAGDLRVRMAGADWTRVGEGEDYHVPAGATFDVEADADVAYLCRFSAG